MSKKLRDKIKKLVLACFVCFAISPVLSAYDEFTEKKYKTFDGKIFDIKENAILHEKVQKNVDLLLEVFKKDIEEFQRQDKTKNKDKEYNYGSGWHVYYYLDKLKEKKDLYEKYDDCLYKIIKSLEEKGIEVEIKLTQFRGTLTTHRSSNLK